MLRPCWTRWSIISGARRLHLYFASVPLPSETLRHWRVVQIEKGTQGIDCRVFNPRNKQQQVRACCWCCFTWSQYSAELPPSWRSLLLVPAALLAPSLRFPIQGGIGAWHIRSCTLLCAELGVPQGKER